MLKYVVNTKLSNHGVINGPISATSGKTAILKAVTNVAGTTYAWAFPAGVTKVSGQGIANVVLDGGATLVSILVKASNSCGTSYTSNNNQLLPNY